MRRGAMARHQQPAAFGGEGPLFESARVGFCKLLLEGRTQVRAIRRRPMRLNGNLASSRSNCLLPPAANLSVRPRKRSAICSVPCEGLPRKRRVPSHVAARVRIVRTRRFDVVDVGSPQPLPGGGLFLASCLFGGSQIAVYRSLRSNGSPQPPPGGGLLLAAACRKPLRSAAGRSQHVRSHKRSAGRSLRALKSRSFGKHARPPQASARAAVSRVKRVPPPCGGRPSCVGALDMPSCRRR